MDPQPEAFVIDDVRFSFTNEGSGWTTGVTIRSDDGADLGAVVGYLLNEIDEQDVPAFLPRVVVRQVEFERAADGALRLSSLIALPEGLAIDLRRLPLVPDTLDDDYQIEFTGLGVELARAAGGDWAARFSGELRFGGKPETLRLPIAADRTPPEPQIVPAERTFGPLSVDSLTVDFDGGKLRVRLNARLGRAGLLIEVIGLRVSIPLATPLDPEFAIDGLAVTYDIPPVKISGGLLVVAHPDYEQFDGSLTVRAGEFGLTALGSYAASAPPSLFAFLQVLAPIGGPPAFYVAGVAGGFGINRRLELPAIEKLEVFPLIQGSRTEAPFTRGAPVGSSIALLNEYMSPLDGRDWVVAGIDVASFGVLRTSALLTLAFGGRVEIGLLGLATLRFPPVGPQVVHARMALRTAVSPAVGELSVRGQLTADSYVLDPDCRLTGGFALCFWFAPHPQGGDFVITLGGYHPGFDVPGHYPAVPRLGVSWAPPLLPLTVKGTHYFALTPALVMTGGVLEANWDVDPIRARFTIQADLVARWAPFHYDLTVGVTFGVDARLGALARHTMSLTVGAELKLWGPRFSGRAHVDLGVMGFTIEFGDAPELEAVPALDWDEFRTSVLGDQTLRLEVRDGLLATAEAGPRVVDPERLVLAAETAVPIKELSVNGHAREIEAERDFGIGPMEIGCDALSSTCAITVQRLDGTPYGGVEVEEIATCGPRALWAPAPPSLDAEPTLRGLVTGLRLTPEGAEGHRIKAHPVGRTQPGRGPTWQRRAALEGPVARAHGGDARAVIAHSLTDPAVAAERARIIAAHLGADFAPDLSGALLLRAEPVLEGLEDDG